MLNKIDILEKTEKKIKQRKANYFEMIFQTEKKKIRTVSFSPEKMGQYFQS